MACNAIHTGPEFLSTTLANLDCQAQAIGAYGFGALSDPTSSVSLALTLLLTAFVAFFGLRLLLGHSLTASDLITDVLKVGIVLALASSWPAWRMVGYDLVVNGPAEVANAIGAAAGLPGSRNDLRARLQDADSGIVAMTVYGSGRLTGGVAAGSDLGDAVAGIAVSDQFAFGTGRALFLSTTLGSFGLVRLGAGILLAIAPLMAGLLLFTGTSAVFIGWLRGLAFCALGSLFLFVAQGAILAMLFPWMSNVLAQRERGVFTISAPTELLVLCLAYAVLTAGILYLTSRLTFLTSPSGNVLRREVETHEAAAGRSSSSARILQSGAVEQPSRAQSLASSVRQVMRREEEMPQDRVRTLSSDGAVNTAPLARSRDGGAPHTRQALGSSYRRAYRRASGAARRRDLTR